MQALSHRYTVLQAILKRPLWKRLTIIWACVSTWDAFVSQFIPAEIAQRFPKAYQLMAMTGGWLEWWQWLIVGSLIVAAASLEFAYRTSKGFSGSRESVPLKATEITSELPQPPQAVRSVTPSPSGRSEGPVVQEPEREQSPSLEKDFLPDSWEKLWRTPGNGNVYLHFFPDTTRRRSDGLLLLIYGHQLIKHEAEALITLAHHELEVSLREAHHSPMPRLQSMMMFSEITGAPDYGREYIDLGYIERVRLSEGGYYRLTQQGLRYVRSITAQAIAQA